MKKTFWIATVFAIILVIFSVQNAKEVTVKFFFEDVSISLAVLLISVFIFGAITGASYFFIWKRKERKKDKLTTEAEQQTINETTE
ncbi:LapA family protein [Carboxylicivirga caseinilyticus]|uniref:LapA family protein n=1 Tax=Carboxylicivirga caseinilyticus TaxID=3417572 RepID=UPI003D33C15D|nr:LapA family protein [Marinilabiliaceae bacterium A049]